MSSLRTLVLLAAMVSMGAESQVQEQSPGAAEITGRVTDQETGRAIAGVVVRLARLGDNNGEAPSAVTDGEGRYRFLGLRAGTYTGFADDGKHLPARLPAVGGRPVALADGEALKNVDVTMARGRAITVKVALRFVSRPLLRWCFVNDAQRGPGLVDRTRRHNRLL